MDFTNKYISTDESKIKPDATKLILSNDAYAIGEQIDNLIKQLKRLELK